MSRHDVGFTTSDRYRAVAFLSAVATLLLVAGGTVAGWWRLSLQSERYSHLMVVPALSALLIYQERAKIFSGARHNWKTAKVAAVAVLLYVSSFTAIAAAAGARLSLQVLAIIAGICGIFAVAFGPEVTRKAGFPLAFLVFAVPLPAAVLDKLVLWLQLGSAAVVDVSFSILQVPFVRMGMQFDLPGVSIEVAEQCSGIRSSIALLLVTLILGHLALRSRWRQMLLASSVVPLVLFKNGVRIVTLTLLAIRVDRRFLTGAPHKQGGFFFFGLALAIVFLFCQLLRRGETAAADTNPSKKVAGAAV